jgi:hypothetical protein
MMSLAARTGARAPKRAGALAENDDALGVSAKVGNVAVREIKRGLLILERKVARGVQRRLGTKFLSDERKIERGEGGKGRRVRMYGGDIMCGCGQRWAGPLIGVEGSGIPEEQGIPGCRVGSCAPRR